MIHSRWEIQERTGCVSLTFCISYFVFRGGRLLEVLKEKKSGREQDRLRKGKPNP